MPTGNRSVQIFMKNRSSLAFVPEIMPGHVVGEGQKVFIFFFHTRAHDFFFSPSVYVYFRYYACEGII